MDNGDSNQLATPDFTPEAIVSLVLGVLFNAVVLLGIDMNDAKKAAVTGLVTTVTLAAFLIHSAVIRKGRAMGSAQRNSAG